MPHRMKIAAVVAVIAFSVLAPSLSAQAAGTPTEECPTLPPGGTSVPKGPVVEQTVTRSSSNDDAECEPGSFSINIPLGDLIKLVEANGYDVVEHGVIDAVIQDNDTMVLELRQKTYFSYQLALFALAIGALWLLDRQHRQKPNSLK